MAEKLTAHRRITPIKKRSNSCYNKKVKRITDWYNHLTKCRGNPIKDNLINPNTKQEPKRKELKSLDYYIGLLKKSLGESR
jgi:hypothetical protein